MKEMIMLSSFRDFVGPLLIPIVIFAVVNKLIFDGQLSKWLINGVEKVWVNIPRWKQKITVEYINHHQEMEKHNHRFKINERISNMITLLIFVLLAGNMYIYAVAFFSLTIVSVFSGLNMVKLASGLVLTCLMYQVARYYKADAYNLAEKYHINIYPWRHVKQTLSKK